VVVTQKKKKERKGDVMTEIIRGFTFTNDDMEKEGHIWLLGQWNRARDKNNKFRASMDPLDSFNYIRDNTRWFECEARGSIEYFMGHFLASEMRLIREIPKIIGTRFAIECCRHTLPVFEEKYPGDKRPREMIKASEKLLRDRTDENRIAVENLAFDLYDSIMTAWNDGNEDAACMAKATFWIPDSFESIVSAVWPAWILDDIKAGELEWQRELLLKLIKE